MVIPRISIHALREEGDRPAINPRSTSGDFYPRPPRGGRHGAHLRPSCPSNFYPRPPRGGRRRPLRLHPPHTHISIHALREEGDTTSKPRAAAIFLFLSTPSARRATGDFKRALNKFLISIHALREEGDIHSPDRLRRHRISIHALREEGDSRATTMQCALHYFYPRPPRGGRRRSPGKERMG